ncbi:MerR family transcriptional regulator [Pseudomonas sp. BCA14]|uniref:helix-turn-helix domain-containing protein n=1 Tax=unclassified Pseudomonas TaxID=196821 RepID=UPI00106E2F3B|nr:MULTISPECIES: helix-turn-helix domain-containing protein [unclassified Pseudomonas]TFF02478.1 MerR family transcriptional regulator [Pseudomonas sp. JMN1]TFF03788.1 MerR family transcriptional regulator [Pseudomonas sp. BCA17]TFF18181.1 MerR family transcriptional regulator [Pseudomonas sp. BCA14]TFF18280.1 MerR family transcriptional regulator [Pseudomonas sp. BCA13]
MDITDVVKRTGIPAHTLRFYEKKGLITSISPPGARRQFAATVVEQLAVIALGQAGGLSLDEIQAMLPPSGQVTVDRAVLLAKADELDATVKQLQAMSKGLRHAAKCPAPSHAQCPNFRRLLDIAAAGAFKRPRHRAGQPDIGVPR